jgi:transketolase
MIDIAKHNRMANALRVLSMDAVQAANSGHPGLPMGAADIATVLFTRFLKFDATAPHWADRDRFILSAGHGSMLLYSLLHLTGYEDITIDEIKRFRQLGSRTAGHPEYGFAAGIEMTTGPLGQGIATSVGMALAERLLAAQFGDKIVDHHTYVLASDGDLMEGISQEAVALAGHLKLGKLIVLYDDNGISIDGPLSLSDSTNQLKRFEASNWHVMGVDGHDPAAIAAAIEAAKSDERPSLIACRTIIGFGAPKKQGTSGVHGSPLGTEEIAAARQALGWTDEPFVIPTDVRDMWRIAGIRACKQRRAWEEAVEALDLETRAEFERRLRGDLPAGFGGAIQKLKEKIAKERPKIATRVASQNALEVINTVVPETVGGSADLTPSNNTRAGGLKEVTPTDYSGRYIHYGIREHGMAAAMNGIALHKGFIPYGGTFLIFSDYCRPSIRLSALMHQRVVYVMTHDSIGLGEDGPTHQPVEQLASLRAVPNLLVMRPADAMETAECWQIALEHKTGPSLLALTRQNLPLLRQEADAENLSARGAYEIAPVDGDAEVVIFASGSEVEIAVAAKDLLDKSGHKTRVVSVPCFELFEQQSAEYRSQVLGTEKIRVAIEAAVSMGWERFIGADGIFIGMHGFGASGPYQELYKHFGITADAAVEAVMSKLSGKN